MAPAFLPPTPLPLRSPSCLARAQHARCAAPRAVAAPIPAHDVPTHLLTILSPALPAPARVADSLRPHLSPSGARLLPFRRLSSGALELSLSLPASASADALRDALHAHARRAGVDAVLQEVRVARATKRLAVFDLDSTLITQETIDELAAHVDAQQQVKNITARAMNGEMGFREALAERVRLLRGMRIEALEGVKERVSFTPGARDLVQALRGLGCKTAVVSGGFHFLADHVRDVLGLDYCFANRLEDEQGVLTGRTVGEVVDGEFKERALKRLAAEMRLQREEVLAVGDGSNDLLMMGSAGLGVAFNAKPVVQDQAKARLNQPSLRNVLYLLGLSEEDIQLLVR